MLRLESTLYTSEPAAGPGARGKLGTWQYGEKRKATTVQTAVLAYTRFQFEVFEVMRSLACHSRKPPPSKSRKKLWNASTPVSIFFSIIPL